jgi:tetratricopeptide (TPR) repeat protein
MKTLILLFILLGTGYRLPLLAKNSIFEKADEMTDTAFLWDYGQKLQAHKKFHLAILEYNRLLYECPQYSSKNLVCLRIGQCYDSIAQPNQALRFYEEAIQATPVGDPLAQWLLLLSARNRIAQGKFAPALAELYSLDTLNSGKDQADIYHLLAAVALHHLGSTDQCKNHLFQLDVEAEHLLKYEHAISASKRPNPNAAMVMSAVLPGAGQWYSGSKREAMNSLLINTLFLTLTIRTTRLVSTLDVMIAILPWFQRYYVGGYNRASLLAYQKQRIKQRNALEIVLQQIPRNRIHEF